MSELRCTGPRCDDIAHFPPCELAGIQGDRPVVVTPVEERIDHEEAKKMAEIWAAFPTNTGMRRFGRAYLALLTEHSIYEEFIRRQGMRQAFSHWRPLLLPATEPAQPEQGHTEECEERRYLHHVATGGDLEDCSCPVAQPEEEPNG